VLATVVAGISISRRSSVIYTPESRLLAVNFWRMWIYVLNAFVFLAIGLQLRAMIEGGIDALALLPAALGVSLVLIVVRLAWVSTATLITRWIETVRNRGPLRPWSSAAVIGWTGMRGIVSLAAALAIPYRTANGAPFPGRDAIVFITFVVIFVTLVGQGLTLIPLLHWLKVGGGSEGEQRELAVRLVALEAGLRAVGELERVNTESYEREVLERLRDEYQHRIEHLGRHDPDGQAGESPESRFDHLAQHAAIQAERRAIKALRDRGEIPDDIFRTVQYDMDLAEARLF
jgi:NhaP-type Na+/H+ or K+/H+ antiporter